MRDFLRSFALLILLYVWAATSSCSKSSAPSPDITDTTTINQPALTGRLVYSCYSCYGCDDSKLYIYNFSTNVLKRWDNIWAMHNCMNAQFSPDGKKIVFMSTGSDVVNWDVFIWTVDSAAQPVNLTAELGASSRDEDPKFSNSGTHIVFKHNGHLSEMDLLGNITRTITSVNGQQSMPYYNPNDSVIVYTEGDGAAMGIYKITTNGAISKTSGAVSGIPSYYPIGCDSVSFYYAGGATNDQLWRGFYDGTKTSVLLPFNKPTDNYSDVAPSGSQYVFLSSTRPGTRGGYDLYIADVSSGKIWSLSFYNPLINSANAELGSCYTPY